MIQTISTILALIIAVTALIFTLVIGYKIFLANRKKKVKVKKLPKKELKQQEQMVAAEKVKNNEPDIKLFASETTKVTGFELDDD